MKDGIIWIAVVVAVLGAALLGGYFVLRGAGNAAAPVGVAAGSTATASQGLPAPAVQGVHRLDTTCQACQTASCSREQGATMNGRQSLTVLIPLVPCMEAYSGERMKVELGSGQPAAPFPHRRA